MRWRPGLRPGPRWGSSRCFPRPVVGWGRTPQPQRLQRLDPRALDRRSLLWEQGRQWAKAGPAILSLTTARKCISASSAQSERDFSSQTIDENAMELVRSGVRL